MNIDIIDNTGQSPYTADDTRSWVEQLGRKNGVIKPNLVLRWATDTNYMLNMSTYQMPAYPNGAQTNAILNNTLPGMRVPGVLNWQVTESLDNPVQTASFECINALMKSNTITALTSALPADYHNYNILASYAKNADYVVETIAHNAPVSNYRDHTELNLLFHEDKVVYRSFQDQTFSVSNPAGFPDPGIPMDDDGNDVAMTYPYWMSSTGVGSYFILIDDEVVRVVKKSGSTFYIPPGGRAINNVLQAHSAGAPVTLLGYGSTNDWTAMGYLDPNDFKPFKCLLRPGACLVSYEGYGDFDAPLSHAGGPNYEFTGFWFVGGIETSLGEDMVPRARVDLVGAGELLNKQQITPDLVQRIVNQFGQWRVGESNQTIWGAADHTRNIPGDWVDYNNWDPSLRDSYPLKIKTEFAQHKEFFEHMQSTNFGVDCDVCQQEKKEWLKTHQDPVEAKKIADAMPDGSAKTKQLDYLAELNLSQNRQIGRHIYKQSIRVLDPVKTYLRLMGTLAMAAWDHPAYGTELAQRYSKIPNQLYDNMRNIGAGLVYDGQVSFTLTSSDADFDWQKPTYEDTRFLGNRIPLTCPFDSSYDKTPFYQPMQDVAEVNDATFYVNRQGFIVMMPRDWIMRPFAGTRGRSGNWFLAHGGSISAYTHSITTDSVITQCWVTATTPFETTNDDVQFTVASSGTGWSGSNRIVYSPIAGNKDGLALTGGVQQVETASMDNQVLGLDWNTDPAGYGLQYKIDGDGDPVLALFPQLYDGNTEIGKGNNAPKRTALIQKTINFFLIRRYIASIGYNSKTYYTIYEDGNFGGLTEAGLVELQTYLINQMPSADRPSPVANIQAERTRKNYGRDTFLWIRQWLSKNDADHYIKSDIWWYVYNGRSWNEYIGAITGIQVPLKRSGVKKVPRTSDNSLDTPLYVIDDLGLQAAVGTWSKNFTKQAVNYGNRIVDDSINKATVRSLSVSLADPRIQPGDAIWATIPGHLEPADIFGRNRAPFTNGIYVTQITRQMDLLTPTYTAEYSGYRYLGGFGANAAPTGTSYFYGG